MKNILLSLSVMVTFSFANSCADLMKTYHTPNPAIKTMRQLKRWVKRKMRNSPDKSAVLQCLVARAADNPNKATVAGE